MARAISVVIMIEVIFLLSIYAEISTTTNGGPGTQSLNLTYLIYNEAIVASDIGSASAGAMFAIILANIVAFFLVRIVGKNLD